ncbi:MAG: hypothetical protein ACAH83_03040 [Alphaproteobacteria bacterium]
MKTGFTNGALTCLCLAIMALLPSFPAQAVDAIPSEQSTDQTVTLYASQSTFYRELQAFTSFMPIMEISRRVNQKVEEERTRLSIGLAWAKEKTEVKDSAKMNSLYFMIYSDLAAKSVTTVPKKSEHYLKYSKAAYQALLTFEVMLMTDAVRCVNPNTQAAVEALLSPRFKHLQYVADSSTPAEIEEFWKTALAHEAASMKRPGNGELCSNGIAAELARQAGKPAPEILDATFIDEAKWHPLREQTRTKLMTEWMKDYEPVAEAWAQKKAQQEAMRLKQEAYQKAQLQAVEDQKKLKAQQAAEAAEKKRQEDEKFALEKKEREEKVKREAGKYQDSYKSDTPAYTGGDDSYTPYNSND